MAKRMVNDAGEVNKITEHVRQEGNKTVIGGNLEVDGNLTVKGTAPGGASLHVYKVKGTANSGFDVYFLWTSDKDNMTTSSMTDELTYKLSSGSGFGMSIPAVKDQMGYEFCVVDYSGGLRAGAGTSMSDMTINTVYKIY